MGPLGIPATAPSRSPTPWPLSLSTSGFDFSSAIGGWAGGGSGVIGGNPGVDQNTLSLNGTPIKKVGRGELLTVSPNAGVNPNARVSSPAPNYTVVAPQHFDLSNAVLTPDLMRQIGQQNKAYTDALVQAGYSQAVRTAGQQAPGNVRDYNDYEG